MAVSLCILFCLVIVCNAKTRLENDASLLIKSTFQNLLSSGRPHKFSMTPEMRKRENEIISKALRKEVDTEPLSNILTQNNRRLTGVPGYFQFDYYTGTSFGSSSCSGSRSFTSATPTNFCIKKQFEETYVGLSFSNSVNSYMISFDDALCTNLQVLLYTDEDCLIYYGTTTYTPVNICMNYDSFTISSSVMSTYKMTCNVGLVPNTTNMTGFTVESFFEPSQESDCTGTASRYEILATNVCFHLGDYYTINSCTSSTIAHQRYTTNDCESGTETSYANGIVGCYYATDNDDDFWGDDGAYYGGDIYYGGSCNEFDFETDDLTGSTAVAIAIIVILLFCCVCVAPISIAICCCGFTCAMCRSGSKVHIDTIPAQPAQVQMISQQQPPVVQVQYAPQAMYVQPTQQQPQLLWQQQPQQQQQWQQAPQQQQWHQQQQPQIAYAQVEPYQPQQAKSY